MAVQPYFILLLLLSCVFMFVASDINFVQNGFLPGSLNLEGSSYVRSNGILTLTNSSSKILGHAFYPSPLPFKKSIQNKSEVVTFSTTFVFSIVPKYPDLGGHGLAFVLISTKDPKGCLVNQYMGLPNETSCLEFSTLYLAVEFDAIQNPELEDINDNHVGIDISSLISNISKPAIYYSSDGSKNTSISLKSGRVIQAWVDYNEEEKLMNVTISPFGILKPSHPLISYPIDLSSVLNDNMYAGFSASNGLLIADYNIHGWSFRLGGKAQDLDKSSLPLTQSRSSNEVVHQKGFAVGITFASAILFILVIAGALHVLIGYGGFGKVYRGVIRCTGLEVAVKRVAPDSRQGMKEFVAEITSMGRIRHRNLVQLHGWCRRHHELLLIYDYVPNGSLDRLLFENEYQKKKILTWDVRYKIVTGVAKALLYLHEECDLRVVHRDVKPSNVLIDADFQPKLGDFGLAKTSEHGIHPKTTHIVGTLGYMAPELTKTGKATTSTDVYGYGILILEVVSGRRAIEPQKNAGELVLVDWVRVLHSKEETTRAVDPSLDAYDKEEADLVLTLGLLCSHPHPDCRPSMRRIVQFLMGDAGLPPLPLDIHCQVPRSITAYTDNFQDDSDASSSRMSSLKSCSHTSFDKVVFANHVERLTF